MLADKEGRGLVEWRPEANDGVPAVDFLFLTSARKKAEGLATEVGGRATFASWAPENPPPEPNELDLQGLIRIKGRQLTETAVAELRSKHLLKEADIPRLYLVGDVHPSIGIPGCRGSEHLVKLPEGLSLENLQRRISAPWIKQGQGPVTVQLASAYAMIDVDARLVTNMPKQDSVFITYPENPLPDLDAVNEYLRVLRTERFPGLTNLQFADEVARIAGGIMNEVLYTYALERGIEGTISQALSCAVTPDRDSIVGIGAGGLTPAIVGWVLQQAKRVVG